MKFIITRTSDYGNENKTIEEAKSAKAISIDRRTCKSFEEVKEQFWGKEWFEVGTNHREENDGVARDMLPENVWIINISNLKQLTDFIDKYGQVVIEPADWKNFKYEIEIYDDYRE